MNLVLMSRSKVKKTWVFAMLYHRLQSSYDMLEEKLIEYQSN